MEVVPILFAVIQKVLVKAYASGGTLDQSKPVATLQLQAQNVGETKWEKKIDESQHVSPGALKAGKIWAAGGDAMKRVKAALSSSKECSLGHSSVHTQFRVLHGAYLPVSAGLLRLLRSPASFRLDSREKLRTGCVWLWNKKGPSVVVAIHGKVAVWKEIG